MSVCARVSVCVFGRVCVCVSVSVSVSECIQLSNSYVRTHPDVHIMS